MLEVLKSTNESEVKSIFNATENWIVDMRGCILEQPQIEKPEKKIWTR